MRILSIDPGFERIGIAILEKNKTEEILHSECFKTSAKIPHNQRLCLIGEKIENIIKKYKPEALIIEKLFFNTNQKTMVGVAEARGVIIYEASKKNLDLFEFTPLEIKIAVTGYGRSEKKQVIDMVNRILKIKNKKTSDDEYDAIAVGLTFFAIHRFSSKYPQK